MINKKENVERTNIVRHYEDVPEIFGEIAEPYPDLSITELKPKKTKVEFVKCEFKHAWEAVKFHSENGLYTGDNNMPLLSSRMVQRFERGGDFYRKVETEITWRDELRDFIDSNGDLLHGNQYFSAEDKDELVMDLIMGNDAFIEMCRVVISAVDCK